MALFVSATPWFTRVTVLPIDPCKNVNQKVREVDQVTGVVSQSLPRLKRKIKYSKHGRTSSSWTLT